MAYIASDNAQLVHTLPELAPVRSPTPKSHSSPLVYTVTPVCRWCPLPATCRLTACTTNPELARYVGPLCNVHCDAFRDALSWEPALLVIEPLALEP